MELERLPARIPLLSVGQIDRVAVLAPTYEMDGTLAPRCGEQIGRISRLHK